METNIQDETIWMMPTITHILFKKKNTKVGKDINIPAQDFNLDSIDLYIYFSLPIYLVLASSIFTLHLFFYLKQQFMC